MTVTIDVSWDVFFLLSVLLLILAAHVTKGEKTKKREDGADRSTGVRKLF